MSTKNNNIFILLLAGMLTCFGSMANATVLSTFKYTGNVTVTGFSGPTLPNGDPNTDWSPSLGASNPDGNNLTMRFVWEIDDNVGNFHDIMHFAGPTSTSGFGTVFVGSPVGDLDIDIGFLPALANILPIGMETFPAGVAPPINLTGTPVLFTTGVNAVIAIPFFPVINVDSALQVNVFEFTGNTLTMDLTEIVNPGPNTPFGELLAGISPDGVFTRPFEFDAQVSAVPVPAAVWLFGTALFGLVINRKKTA